MMLHPSYSDLMKVVNSGVETGDEPVVNSRYSIVLATSKRARQIISGDDPMIDSPSNTKPLSIAVEEVFNSKVTIVGEEESEEVEEA
jgi:DNA-directed RNA polymerase subunit omega